MLGMAGPAGATAPLPAADDIAPAVPPEEPDDPVPENGGIVDAPVTPALAGDIPPRPARGVSAFEPAAASVWAPADVETPGIPAAAPAPPALPPTAAAPARFGSLTSLLWESFSQ